MRHLRPFAVTFALALSVALACNGQLNVGADDLSSAGAPGDDGSVGSGGTQGGGGSLGASGGLAASGGAPVSGSGGASSGGANGSGGSGGSPHWTETVNPTPAVPGSSDDCPVGPLVDDSDCDPVGRTCGYVWDAQDYQECACIRGGGGTGTWHCDYAGGSNLEACPAELPEHESDCYGYIGLTCFYPPKLIECYCSGIDEYTWDCPVPEYRTLSDPPSPPDPAKSIEDLTDAEREAWCEWYSMESSGGPGRPAVVDQPVDEDGYLFGSECHFSHNAPCIATMPVLSVEQCMQNLALSECGSPLSNLNGCVANVHTGKCDLTDYGCPDYLDSPGCNGTIALTDTTACALRVE